jgi:hypothetical protein
MKFAITLFLVAATLSTSLAQTDEFPDSTAVPKGEYALVVYAGGGFSYYSTKIGYPDGMQNVNTNRMGFPASVRIMWHPDHKLRVGIESGWTTMYSYTSQINGSDAQVYLSAVPILLVWSMPIVKRVHLFAGTGTYLINSHLEYEGKTNVNTLSMGWMVAGSYIQPINKNLGLATEVKWMNATETADANLTLQLQLVWKFYRW